MTHNFFRDLASVFDAIGRGKQAAGIYERLSAMSDADLARRGYQRSDLPAAAFRVADDR